MNALRSSDNAALSMINIPGLKDDDDNDDDDNDVDDDNDDV